MTNYSELRKDLYERFHASYEKLYLSELQDQIADKMEIITAHEHVINDQRAEIEGLNIIIKELDRRLENAESIIDKYKMEEKVRDEY